jgi:Flp pilus assembly protein CpaB
VGVGNRRTVIAVIAVVLAVLAGTGVYLYTSSADARAKEDVEMVQAVVATQNIARGTEGDQALSEGLIEKKDVPRSALPPGRVKNPDSVQGKIASGEIASGQFIVKDSFTAAGKGGAFSSGLGKDRQAISVQLDPKQAVAGRIVEGDLVNVIVVGKVRKDPSAPFDAAVPDNLAMFAVQNAKVLAVGQAVAADGTTTATTDTTNGNADTSQVATDRSLVTLEVDAADAQRIALASVTNSAGVWLTLVGPGYTAQDLPFVGDNVTNNPALSFNNPY